MIQTIRSLLYLIGMAVLTIIFGLLCLLTVIVPYEMRYKFIILWSTLNIWWLRLTCGLKHDVIGKENIPDTPCIVMANHQSTWETMAIGTLFPPLTWVVKRELLFIPLFGWGLALTHPIALDRSAGKKAVDQLVEQGKKKLKKGRWILIFPEGTRTPPGVKRKFKAGGSILAAQSGAPIIPVAHNSGTFWARKQLTKKPGTIKVKIGPAIKSDGKTAAQINQEVFNWISAERDALESI
ncbi:MAG: lysophospholipid acyltransferase family protein [Gammaproteobacteria bacterium]